MERPFGLVQCPLSMKSVKSPSSGQTLTHLNLSYMDFLDVPAAIHGSRLTISRFTKDDSPNEHIDPEISSNNHPKLGTLPLGEGGGANHSPPVDAGDKIW